MTPFKYISRGNTKKAWILFGVMMSIAALALIVMYMKFGVPLIAQTIFLLSLMGGAYILIRFVTAAYIYEVLWEDDGARFCVTRLQGKKAIMQCNLPVSAITVITPADRAAGNRPALNYSPVALPEDDTYLCFVEDGETTVLRINANAAFLDALKSIAHGAKDTFPSGAESKSTRRRARGPYDLSDLQEDGDEAEEVPSSEKKVPGPYDLPDMPEDEENDSMQK